MCMEEVTRKSGRLIGRRLCSTKQSNKSGAHKIQAAQYLFLLHLLFILILNGSRARCSRHLMVLRRA